MLRTNAKAFKVKHSTQLWVVSGVIVRWQWNISMVYHLAHLVWRNLVDGQSEIHCQKQLRGRYLKSHYRHHSNDTSKIMVWNIMYEWGIWITQSTIITTKCMIWKDKARFTVFPCLIFTSQSAIGHPSEPSKEFETVETNYGSSYSYEDDEDDEV